MIHVTHIVPDLGRGGAQQRLVRMLEHVDPGRCRSTVVSLWPELDRDLSRRAAAVADVAYLDRTSMSRARTLFELARTLRRSPPTVVHTHRFAIEYARLAPVRLPPVVHTMGNLPDRDVPAPWLRPLHARTLRSVRTVAVSERIAAAARDQFGLDGVTVIRTGAPVAEAELTAPVDWRTELGLGSGPVLLSIGRLAPQKAHDDLIRAMATEELAFASLVLVGDGPERSSLVEQVDRLGVRDRVRLVGLRDDPLGCLAGADAFALTSHWEGSSNAVLEAMACGLAVVATNVGGTAELVEEGVSGLVVEPGDHAGLVGALGSVLGDGARRRSMGRSGRDRARREFSLTDMAARHIELYRELAAQRG